MTDGETITKVISEKLFRKANRDEKLPGYFGLSVQFVGLDNVLALDSPGSAKAVNPVGSKNWNSL
jgi:hypothetical protein